MPTIVVPENVKVEVDGTTHDFGFVDGFINKTILRDPLPRLTLFRAEFSTAKPAH
jgi:hypothetical protein